MRQKKLLLILIAILVLSTIYALWASPRSEKRVASDASDRPAPVLPAQGGGDESREQGLRIEMLEPEKREYPGFERDIFGPLFAKSAPKPKPKPKPEPKPVKPVVKKALEPVKKPEPVRQEVREALARFTFLGFLDKGAQRTVFLSKSEEIFLVKEGERFGENERFAVLEITPDILTIRQDDNPRLIQIPLVEKEPLVPSF